MRSQCQGRLATLFRLHVCERESQEFLASTWCEAWHIGSHPVHSPLEMPPAPGGGPLGAIFSSPVSGVAIGRDATVSRPEILANSGAPTVSNSLSSRRANNFVVSKGSCGVNVMHLHTCEVRCFFDVGEGSCAVHVRVRIPPTMYYPHARCLVFVSIPRCVLLF